MKIEQFKTRMKQIKLERVSEMQAEVLPFFMDLKEEFSVDKVVLDADDNTLDVYFRFMDTSGIVSVYACEEDGSIRGWAEFLIEIVDDELHDEISQRCFEAAKAKNKYKIILKGHALIVGIPFSGITTSYDLLDIIGGVYHMKTTIQNSTSCNDENSTDIDEPKPNCTVESTFRH